MRITFRYTAAVGILAVAFSALGSVTAQAGETHTTSVSACAGACAYRAPAPPYPSIGYGRERQVQLDRVVLRSHWRGGRWGNDGWGWNRGWDHRGWFHHFHHCHHFYRYRDFDRCHHFDHFRDDGFRHSGGFDRYRHFGGFRHYGRWA